MKRVPAIRKRSFLCPGRLIPNPTDGLRARCVELKRGGAMDWHTTGPREELLFAVIGSVSVEVRPVSGRSRRLGLRPNECVWLPGQTVHRVLNIGSGIARYVYVTGRAASAKG